ncbi:unnamed protein product [Fusarium graminearum]|uniref:Chromosome 2, complete genome n=1 Tax=Gibberella zeae (strain ATCC MYA-4620 / CBS 123657 / FGSC 9075 / NRRL 31084 / PH-1) TaxID=229533 RepID=A0A098DCM5_GIBZE|nr:unnamed protein product [Fusarium graminearum]CZS79991.1 unnamed protein product [Fusarium graminearum]
MAEYRCFFGGGSGGSGSKYRNLFAKISFCGSRGCSYDNDLSARIYLCDSSGGEDKDLLVRMSLVGGCLVTP